MTKGSISARRTAGATIVSVIGRPGKAATEDLRGRLIEAEATSGLVVVDLSTAQTLPPMFLEEIRDRADHARPRGVSYVLAVSPEPASPVRSAVRKSGLDLVLNMVERRAA